MLITIKYFGQLIEATNTTQESYSINKNNTLLKTIEVSILEKYPDLKNITYNIAVNQKIGSKNETVNSGDVLAFLPPFAGG